MSAGVVNREGVFTPLALPPAGVAEELFRRRVIKMMRERGGLEDEVAAGLLAWRHYIPPPGLHLTRLYGAYANRTRGARARRMAGAGERPASGDGDPDALAPSQRARRRQWTGLIAKVFEVDPLRCACGGTMRVIAFILDPVVIRKIRVRGRLRAPGCVRRGNRREAGSLDTPIRGRHGGACRRMSGPARSLPVAGAAIGDPADPCAPLQWPEG